jgi:predicted outer membrane protein
MRNLLATVAIAALTVSAAPAFAQTAQGGDQNQGSQAQNMQGQNAEAMSFATNAAQNSFAEIVLSSLALQKSDNQRVVDFSEMMIDQHSTAAVQLMKLLNEGEMTVPVTPGQNQMQAIERLQSLSGEEFNQAYFEHQVEAHQKAVSLFEKGAESAQSEELQRFAEMKLPLLRAHLEIAKEAMMQMGQAGSGSQQMGQGQSGSRQRAQSQQSGAQQQSASQQMAQGQQSGSQQQMSQAQMSGGDQAMVAADDQKAEGNTVVVGSVMMPEDGFVVIHSVKDGKPMAPQSIGHTAVKSGGNQDVRVELEYTPQAGEDFVAMLHRDTGQMGTYEFGPGSTDVDLPVMKDGKPVIDPFKISQ